MSNLPLSACIKTVMGFYQMHVTEGIINYNDM